MVEKDKIEKPQLHIDSTTLTQLQLIQTHDPQLLHGQCFRVQIASKGCEGFRYEFGITEPLADDFVLEFDGNVNIHVQPFCAFYLQQGTLHYEINPQTNLDGFIVKNLNQDKFEKKFWKENEDLIPPQRDQEDK